MRLSRQAIAPAVVISNGIGTESQNSFCVRAENADTIEISRGIAIVSSNTGNLGVTTLSR